MHYDRGGIIYNDKSVMVLQVEMDSNGNDQLSVVEDHWVETEVTLCDKNGICEDQVFNFDEPGNPAQYNIAGFVQASDDALRVIHFVHTYQIPSLR